MRFIKGDSLKEAIERFHKSPPRLDALDFRQLLGRFIDICQAVAYAHSRGVLHRDLKPGNVMLGKYGETLLVDWGLAKPLGNTSSGAGETPEEPPLMPSSASGSGETLPGRVIGTPAYMSPEQAEGRLEQIGPASDVYGLGAILYAALTGRPPVTGSIVDVLDKVIHGEIAPPRSVNAAVPPALQAVCLKALALKPADRYASALDLAADLEHWLADEPVTAWAEPLADRARRWVRKHRTLTTSVAVGVVLAAGGLTVLAAVLSAKNRALEQANLAEQAAHGEAQENLRQARKAVDNYYPPSVRTFCSMSQASNRYGKSCFNRPGLLPAVFCQRFRRLHTAG